MAQKQSFVRTKLHKWEDYISGIISPPDNQRWFYRGKVCLSIAFYDGKWQTGMIKRQDFVPVSSCPLHAPGINETADIIMSAMPPPPAVLPAFYMQSGKQSVLIVKSINVAADKWINEEVTDNFISLHVEGFHVHVNPSAGRRQFNKSGWYYSWGKQYSVDENGMMYGIMSFRQQIAGMAMYALEASGDFFAIQEKDIVVDLYCGTGSGLKLWNKKTRNVIGVELNGEAVYCAGINAPEAEVLRGKCSERVPQVKEWINKKSNDNSEIFVYVNPPRTGIEPEVLQWLCEELLPARMVYLSCSPGTLSRDMEIITQSGYKVKRIQPYDFFPQTHHVECLVLIERDKYIRKEECPEDLSRRCR